MKTFMGIVNERNHDKCCKLCCLRCLIVVLVYFYSLVCFFSSERYAVSISNTASCSVPPPQLSSHHPRSSSNSDDPSIAILISGQCHRFMYRDQTGPLFASTSTTTTTTTSTGSLFKVDVYIMLQCGTKIQPFTGQIDTPKYMEHLNVTDIEQWYLSRGANSVTIRTIYAEQLDAIIEEVSAQAFTIHSGELYNDKLQYMLGTDVWHAEMRRLYLRHLVFSMAQKVQQYTGYVMHREDNYFLEPIDMETMYFGKNHTEEKPFVIVDEHCEFGSFSDKIYIANHEGAASLFSSTRAEFMLFMKRFLLFAFYHKQANATHYLQAERFEHDTILFANVEKIDLKRFDTRYVNGMRCVPTMYFYCQPESRQITARQNGLTGCDNVPKQTPAIA